MICGVCDTTMKKCLMEKDGKRMIKLRCEKCNYVIWREDMEGSMNW
jgi:hypothetical protein